MIQPQNGQPGVIGQQHGLQRLTETLETLSTGQKQQQARDTALEAQLTGLLVAGQRLFVAVLGLGVLTLGLTALVGWQLWHPPDMGYARALGALDATLAQQWGSLPKPVQDSLTRTYGQRGWTSPGDRQGARQ